MFKTNLMQASKIHHITETAGCFQLLEYDRDISVSPASAATAYFAQEMNVRKRQVIASLDGKTGVTIQSGAMQMMIGQVEAATNVKGAGDLVKKFVGSKVTGESAIKPQYVGEGLLILEPTYRYVLFEDLARWNGNMVIEDGLFLACENSVNLSVVARASVSSAVLGGEGLFSTALTGSGVAVLESPVPREELIEVELQDDTLKIDGSMAIVWSESLKFTVERTTKTLIGSAASKEGLVNVYRGTGRVLIAPVAANFGIATPESV
ncbi:MAG: AIM24 family protein [Clostridia bacterium]|nr:AIM24 family protein [Clostridia bacterium]